MTEEDLTMAVVDWLRTAGWDIRSIDYPGRGSGLLIQIPNGTGLPQAKGGWRPDIVAARSGVWAVFEDKDRFDPGDFDKVQRLRASGPMVAALRARLSIPAQDRVEIGIGLPDDPAMLTRALARKADVDFIVVVASGAPPLVRIASQSGGVLP